jgi:hypothetical protein
MSYNEVNTSKRRQNMTNEQFERLVRKLEKQASHNPSLYRLQVSLLTGLGYGYVLAFLAIFVTLLLP